MNTGRYPGITGRFVEFLPFEKTMQTALKMASDLPRNRYKGKNLRSSDVRNEVRAEGNMRGGLTRLRVFAVHGCKCEKCGREGTHIIHTIDNGGGHHIDLYGIDDNGKFFLVNRDHILPASKGGQNHLWNLRPMCQPCNSARGNEYTEEDRRLYESRLKWAKWGKRLFNWVPFLHDKQIYALASLMAKLF